jgi:hypothetical protein
VVMEICVKYPGGPTWITATDMTSINLYYNRFTSETAALKPFHFRNGYVTGVLRFTSETTACIQKPPVSCIQKRFKISVAVIQGGTAGRVGPEEAN